MNIYYVYQFLRENGTPYYIGMGSKNRAYSNCRTIPRPKSKDRIKIIAHKLSKSEAFLLETKLIKLYGRIELNTGILRNKTDGGEGSPNVANKIAWNKGKKQSKEHNLKISNSLQGQKKSSSHKEKIKLNHKKSQKGKHWWNNGTIEIMSVNSPGEDYIQGRVKNSRKFHNTLK